MLLFMVGDTGFEPVHVGIKIRCLSNLANPHQSIINCGTTGGIRTPIGRFRRALPYPLDYGDIFWCLVMESNHRYLSCKGSVLPLN